MAGISLAPSITVFIVKPDRPAVNASEGKIYILPFRGPALGRLPWPHKMPLAGSAGRQAGIDSRRGRAYPAATLHYYNECDAPAFQEVFMLSSRAAVDVLRKYDQEHVLAFFNDLPPQGQQELLEQIAQIDFEQVD